MVARRAGLGRGLSSLIPQGEVGTGDSYYQEVAISSISPNPFQPRRHFDEEALGYLAASISSIGVLQPVLVRSNGNGDYHLIAGERRWRAAKRAGLLVIPALIQDVDDLAALERAVVENLHRADLNPLEEASAYQQLIEDFSLTHEDVARRVGKSRVSITNALRLLQLPAAVQALIAGGQITSGHARALLGSRDRVLQEQLAELVVDSGLTVREIEDRVRETKSDGLELNGSSLPSEGVTAGRTPSDLVGRPMKPAGVLELEVLLAEGLQTRVSVDLRSKGRSEGALGGRVVIDFGDLDDLERIAMLIFNYQVEP